MSRNRPPRHRPARDRPCPHQGRLRLVRFPDPGGLALFNRLWRDLFLFLLITVAVVGAVHFAGGNAAAITWAALLINLAFGFEARNIYRAALQRRGYALIGVVTARNLAEAERRFLSEWLPGVQPGTGRSAAASVAGEAGPMPIMGAGMAHS